MHRLRLAIIGCGIIAETHAEAIGRIPRAELVMAADIDGQRARDFAARHGVSRHAADYREVLADPAVDAVILCLPPYLHREVVVASAEARKHVLCEKPIALTLADADAMIGACASNGVKLMIGFVRRFDAEWLKFRELVRGGAIGRPVLWRFAYGSSGPAPRWDLERGKGGGVVVQWGVHHFDFARFIFGPLASVKSSCKILKDGATTNDTGTAILDYRSGDQAMVSFTWGLPHGAHTGRLNDAIGPEGAILWQDSIPAGLIPRGLDPDESGVFMIDRGAGGKEFVRFEKNDIFSAQDGHFVQAVLSGGELAATGLDGREALAAALRVLNESGMEP